MIFSRYINRIAAATLPALIAAGMTGCADEQFPGLDAEPGSVVLHIGAAGTRADGDNGTVAAEDDERNVTNLRYFLFPKYDTSGEFRTGLLTTPSAQELANGRTYTLEDVKLGHYRIYVVANVPEAASCTTEEGLQQTIIDHAAKLNTNYKKNGTLNLPMLAECGDFSHTPESSTNVNAEMKFACAKVSYRLLFYNDGDQRRDGKTAAKRPFGNNGYFVKDVSASGMVSQTPLSLTGADLTEFPLMEDSKSYGIPAYSTSWTDNGINARDNEDVVPGEEETVSFGGKYIVSGVMYLPERYVDGTDSEDGVWLPFDGYQTASDATYTAGGTAPANKGDHTYKVRVGHAESDMWQLARGTYYEVVAEVVNPQATELEATVKMAEWTVHNMAGDMSHTILTVDKTRASVSSLRTDSITYTTNAPEVTMGVPEEYRYQDKDLISLVKKDRTATATNTLTFRVNPEIPYDAFGEGAGKIPTRGTVPVWIQAGNVRKYLDVTYDVSPLFEVSPEGAVIQWKAKSEGTEEEEYQKYLTATFEYYTNLGGLTIDDVTSGKRYNSDNGKPVENANGLVTISIVPDKDTNSHGYITVHVEKSPGDETVKFNLTTRPATDGYNYLSKTLEVAVKPTYDTYRIYFRAINDNQDDENLADYSSNPECTWGSNKFYIYTQMGQTVNGSIPTDWVWLFTGGYPGKDPSNKSNGWSRYDLKAGQKGIVQADDDETYKYPAPGETLIIFSDGGTDTRHRMAFAGEPGIQLYDYEDKEGYYIFDPLSSPYSKVYDERPEIESVQYRIFTEKEVSEVYIKYGGAESNWFTLKLTPNSQNGKALKNEYKQEKNGTKRWYMNEFYAQCPAGDYSKGLTVKFEDGEETVLFDGQNYYNSSNKGISRGIYENGEWRMGAIELEGVVSTTRTIYLLDNGSNKWSRADLYAWDTRNNNASNAGFPGVQMTKLANTNWWKIDISTAYNYIIFSSNQNDKSEDIQIDLNSSSIYYERTGSNSYSVTNARPQ